MSVTFAHPAAILPIARLRRESGWLGGLLAGSVAPDLVQGVYGYMDRFPHSIRGMVSIDAFVAVALAWLAHTLIVPRARRLPGLEDSKPGTAFSWIWAYLGAVLGGGSHIGLDLVTHPESPLASTGFLAIPISGPAWYEFTIANLLWFLSSVGGTAYLLGWLAMRYRRTCGDFKPLLSWRWIVLSLAILLPFLPVLRVTRHLWYHYPLLEFLLRLDDLSDWMKLSILASCILGLAIFFLVTIQPLTPIPPPASPPFPFSISDDEGEGSPSPKAREG